MKVYYTTSRGHSDPSLEELVQNTIPYIITRLDNSVDYYAYNPTEVDGGKSFSEIAEQIQEADIFIGEMSRPSQTLGFQLAYAISLGKPSLYIYNQSRQGKPDLIIAQHPSRLLRLATYQTTDDIEKELQSFFKAAKTQMSTTRTTFMSTHRIDQYVEISSRQLGISKGEVIRQLLDEAITNNKLGITS